MSDHSHSHAHAASDGPPAHVHVVPLKVLFGIWAALVFLTWVTVAASKVHFGQLIGEPWLNVVGALLIAVVKASLVALYFMHLRYEHPFHGFVLVAALAFVALLITIALVDTREYDEEKIPNFAPRIEEAEKARTGAADPPAGGDMTPVPDPAPAPAP